MLPLLILLVLIVPLAHALQCGQGELLKLKILSDGSEVFACGALPSNRISNDTTRAPAYIASYVLVDDDNLRFRMSKSEFYSHVAMDVTTDNRVCHSTTYNRKGVDVPYTSTLSGKIWLTKSSRHADNIWYFFPLGKDTRDGLEYFDVSTICVSRGVYFPVLHWEDAPTTRRQHIYLFLAFDPKAFTGLLRVTEYSAFNAVYQAYGHRVHIGNILRGLKDGELSLRLLTENIKITNFEDHHGGTRLAFDSPVANRDWAEMGTRNNIWSDLKTLLTIVKAIYPWLMLFQDDAVQCGIGSSTLEQTTFL
ncbi:hypothetical protein K457DRAFT_18697 [Linnemannia elongata AG-77]|uniref:Uncharacterized protein n=1 Tax=Linnemannia elongata AG-77 TaxID=1314771 RepID=A0A197JX91_9FUNG|nr:hypothetical protein K457DRAFT_18697 [Linnemannia elongata AG-77]